MSDRQLRQDILDVFQWDPRIEAAHIVVVVEKGFVTLTGSVMSNDERAAIEHATRHVDGVRGITEKIEVREPGEGLAVGEIGARATD